MRLAILYSVFCLLSGAPQAVSVDRLVAVVGGEPIFASDVREVERLRLLDPSGFLATAGTSAPDTLERLINRRLALAEISRYSPPPPAPEAVAAAERTWAARFPSEDERRRALASLRDGEAIVRAFLIDTLRIEDYITQRFTAAAQPTRDEAPTDEDRRRLAEERRVAMVRDWLRALRDRAQVRLIR